MDSETKPKTAENVRKSIAKYQKANKEKMQQKCRNYYQRLKQDPVRYQKYLKHRREYVAKKKAAKKAAENNLENNLE
jgi:hypothetical protein